MKASDVGRAGRQVVRIVRNPVRGWKVGKVFVADHIANMYRCADCGHRFARCSNCHKKWPVNANVEVGETYRCQRCGERVVMAGRYV
ncbi:MULTISPECIES: hypothetical protein [Actinomadura]|uniref:Uncharacterized protein n=1 Tax=Actinomadura yumaensis TaxID=111807 RepID=A0ABW2CBV6_9ACTN|nr:hypothetical protein [Actinomadura sp. J1-007]MWK33644.1 hypothetical protein [Actinomadura sp. J1-007]